MTEKLAEQLPSPRSSKPKGIYHLFPSPSGWLFVKFTHIQAGQMPGAIRLRDDEHGRLSLNDADRCRTLGLVAQVLEHVQRGYYNSDVIRGLVMVLELEWSASAERDQLVEQLQSLPASERCGIVEGWQLAALRWIGAERRMQLHERTSIMEAALHARGLTEQEGVQAR